MLKHLLVFLIVIILQRVYSSSATATGTLSLKRPSPPNRFESVNAACSRKALLTVVALREPFHGVLYARGYPLECNAVGNGTHEIKLSFAVDQCGTKLIEKADGSIQYDVYLYLQYERHVQQATDEVIHVQCIPQDVVVSSRMIPGKQGHGTMSLARSPSSTQAPFLAFDSWMDILRGKMPTAVPITEYVNVGEDVTMLIKVRHADGVEAKVVDCIASDGSDENEQLLIDHNGCTLDATIMPNLKEKYNSKTGIKMIFTTFQVFRFPERDNLHLQCRVLVCNSTCPLESCTKSKWGTRSRRRSKRDYLPNVMEEIDVFNSVEVKAPLVDTNSRRPTTSASSSHKEAPDTTTARPDDMFCLNSARMVIIIGILLGVLLISLVVTICMCVRARELRRRLVQRQNFPYGRVHEYS